MIFIKFIIKNNMIRNKDCDKALDSNGPCHCGAYHIQGS